MTRLTASLAADQHQTIAIKPATMPTDTAVEPDIKKLQALSTRLRIGSLVAIYHAGSGHPGGALSAADLMAYISSQLVTWPARETASNTALTQDRFVLSKGHSCPVLYAAAAEAGIIEHKLLATFRKMGSALQGHPHVLDAPWVETSTGSLGQGFSTAVGMALGLRYQHSEARVYAMLGDGELQEGEVWEAAMCAGHYELDNLCAVVDYNKLQSDDQNENIMGLAPLKAKWEAFRWHAMEIDGHNFEEIKSAFDEAKTMKAKPTVIIANTVKGKGVSFMEGSPLWHGSVKLRDEELTQALGELGIAEQEARRYLDGSIWQNGNR
jgi:transketolase